VALERELRRHLEPHPDIRLSFERIAITEEQIAEDDLPTKPRKEGDKRAQHVTATVEAEAMPAGVLRQLPRDRIEALLPPRALQITKVVENAERNQIDLAALAMDRQ
jgi:hypothetical protein